MSTLEEELEEIQQTIASLEDTLQSVIDMANEDGEVSPAEKDLIAFARGQVDEAKEIRDEIEAEIAKGGGGKEGDPGAKLGEGPDADDKDSAQAAWKAYAKPYRKLLGIYADMKHDGHELTSDLGEYLDEIQVAVAQEDWEEALNQGVLAALWVDENGLYDEYERVDEEEEEEEDSGKEAWEKVTKNEDAVAYLEGVQSDLEDVGSEHAAKLGEFAKKIKDALAEEDWDSALQQFVLYLKFEKDKDILVLIGEEEDSEDDYDDSYDDDSEDEYQSGDDPGETAWKGMSKVYTMILDLNKKLREMDHPMHDRIGSYLDEILSAVKKKDWETALSALAKAGKFADDNELWDAEENEGGGDIVTANLKKKLKKLEGLLSDLEFHEHEKAEDLEKLIDKVPDITDPMNMISADRAMEEAYAFADKHNLWDVQSGLPKSEEEELFWEHNGENYRKVKSLRRRLDNLEHEFAKEFGVIIDRVDKNIKDQTYFAAIMGIDQAIELADDEKLWDDTPREAWDKLQKGVEKIRKLYGALYEAEHPSADQIGDLIEAMDDARRGEDWEDAERQYAAAKALADGLKLWDVMKSDDEEDEEEEADPKKAAWEARRSEYDKLVELHDRLIRETHPDSVELGSMLTSITDAVHDEYWEDAEKFLDIAIQIAKDKKLWDAKPSTIIPSAASISASVGQGGKNKAEDVETVQLLLNEKKVASPALAPDGDCGKLTIGAIKKFQQAEFGWKDGKVDPGGKTWGALTGQTSISEVTEKVVDVAEKVVDAVDDAVDKVVETATDVAEDIGDFFEDLLDGDDDDEKKS